MDYLDEGLPLVDSSRLTSRPLSADRSEKTQ